MNKVDMKMNLYCDLISCVYCLVAGTEIPSLFSV